MTPPSIVAFVVAPTSGEAPYVFTVEFANHASFSTGLYVTEFRSIGATGSCPADVLSGSNTPEAAALLLNEGTFTSNSSIAPGTCRGFLYLIRRLSDSEIISQSTVYVDNTV